MLKLYYGVVTLVIAQRLWELWYSRRNQKRLEALGFRRDESGPAYAFMVTVHALWAVALLSEPRLWPRAVPAWISVPALLLFALTQALRYWTMAALGAHWNVNVMTPAVAGAGNFISTGPYRFIRHPNYLVVILEFAMVPLIGGAWRTALIFSALNALVLYLRIPHEEKLLAGRPGYLEAMGGKGRFLPSFHR